MPIPGANSCYNPSPLWNARPLPRCSPGCHSFPKSYSNATPTRPLFYASLCELSIAGFFALEGETTCAHPCSEAAAMGLDGTIACDALSYLPARAALSFAQVSIAPPSAVELWRH